MSCTRPGCTGQMVDGYCDVCGMAAPADQRPPAPAAPGAPGAPAGAEAACARPGCGGQMVDGYCDRCGLAAVAAPAAPVAAPSVAPGTPVPAGPTPCERQGCSGQVVEGYCTECGLAPTGSSVRTAGLSSPSGSGPSVGTAIVRGSSSGSVATAGGTSRASRGNLGAGLVDVPAVPERDPASVVLTDPEVPERKRVCGRCGQPVGRTHEGRPSRTEGFCPHCGARYSFTPKLVPGDLVGGQYEVAGCLAHGGLGWIYLARDRDVSDRWVVLKGLLDSEDEAASAAAIAERRFLAEVEHPNIVKIYNFKTFDDAGYIVMEYVGGESLRELRNRHREEHGAPLPVAQAIAYMLEILPALGFLHRRGLLFCDFKPDNVIQTEEQLKLIDLGGVRSVGDDDSDLYGTIGYQAPEVSESGASVASDLYTVARTLAVLCLDIPGFQDEQRHAYQLPPARDVPVFGRYEAFHQFLVKGTAPEPAARFASAGEMAEQLLGVLRQVVALDGRTPAPAPSTLFSGELGAGSEPGAWADLPVPTVDPFDPAAALLATAALSAPEQARAILDGAPRSPELAFHLARAAIEEGDFPRAEQELESPEAAQGGWRVAWWRGVLHLAAGRAREAQSFFRAVAAELPGELAPKLAQAVAFETAPAGPEDLGEAERYFHIVATTDPSFSSACFGLARARLAAGDRAGAAGALGLVPSSSSSHAAAQLALCQTLSANGPATIAPTLSDLTTASVVLERLRAEPAVRLPLVLEVQNQALDLLLGGRLAPEATVVVAGAPLTEVDLRLGLERTYRSLAKLAATDEERCDLIDRANAHRPRSLT